MEREGWDASCATEPRDIVGGAISPEGEPLSFK